MHYVLLYESNTKKAFTVFWAHDVVNTRQLLQNTTQSKGQASLVTLPALPTNIISLLRNLKKILILFSTVLVGESCSKIVK